jgi:phosphoribosylanthranilate isomerase
MTRTRIKICGVRDLATARAAVDAGADAIGLVFVQASPRRVDVDTARAIVEALPPMVEPVGLFVDASSGEVARVAAATGVGTVQLHGREGPAYGTSLSHLRVIKAIAFDPGHVEKHLAAWRGSSGRLDAVLLDAPQRGDANAGPSGGTGRSLDWTELADMQKTGRLAPSPPLILAGGLTPENVGVALGAVRPYAVDVSSGVESSRGVKDPQRIAAFCRAVQNADRD